MSRTYHHSRNWGRKSRYADPVKHGVYRCGWYGCSNRDVSESPNGFSHASDIVPVQKGFSYGYETPSLLLFRIEVDGVRYNPVSLTRDYPEAAAEILTKWVPYSTDVFSIDVLEKLSKGLEGVSGKKLHIREGVVVEPVEPRLSKRGNFPLYLKVINPKYKDDDESLS